MPDLVKAQSQMGAAKKDAANPFFKSKYADLGAVIEVCKEILNSNNIVYLQPIIEGSVQTILIHTSGEWIADEGTRIISKNENDPQAQGSAITYARRYGLQSFLGIPAEDDDGEKATDHKKVGTPTEDTLDSQYPLQKRCPIHLTDVMTRKNGKEGGYFYSHKLVDNTWCNGRQT